MSQKYTTFGLELLNGANEKIDGLSIVEMIDRYF